MLATAKVITNILYLENKKNNVIQMILFLLIVKKSKGILFKWSFHVWKNFHNNLRPFLTNYKLHIFLMRTVFLVQVRINLFHPAVYVKSKKKKKMVKQKYFINKIIVIKENGWFIAIVTNYVVKFLKLLYFLIIVTSCLKQTFLAIQKLYVKVDLI